MKILLEKKEALEYIHSALCNGLDYVSAYGLEIIQEKAYLEAKKDLITKGREHFCYEDVLTNILAMGGSLKFYDHEGEEYESFDLAQAKKNLESPMAVKHLLDIKNENDDAITADCILQICLFNDIIYG